MPEGMTTPELELHYERICECEGTINGNKATLKGNCRNKALMSMKYFTEGVDVYLDEDLEFSENYVTIKTKANFANASYSATSTVIYKKNKQL